MLAAATRPWGHSIWILHRDARSSREAVGVTPHGFSIGMIAAAARPWGSHLQPDDDGLPGRQRLPDLPVAPHPKHKLSSPARTKHHGMRLAVRLAGVS